MTQHFKAAALAAAAMTGLLASAPAVAAPSFDRSGSVSAAPETWEHSRRHDDRYRDNRGRRNHYGSRSDYGEPVYRNTRTWRGRDGRQYCRRSNGTTGLIIGGAAGALLGRGVDTRGERATGTILGAAAGALLGREIDRGGARCR